MRKTFLIFAVIAHPAWLHAASAVVPDVAVATTVLTGYTVTITDPAQSFTTLAGENTIVLTAVINPEDFRVGNSTGIRWVVDDNPAVPGDSGAPSAPADGASTTLTITAPAAPDARTFPLNFRIRAFSEIQGGVAVDTKTIVQDEIDQARQEYIDMGKNSKPGRSEFSNSGQSSGGNFSFAALNYGDYSYAIIAASLYSGLEAIRAAIGNLPITPTSGYRNPRHNASAGGAPESRHIYGDATDFHIRDVNGDSNENQADWVILANAACDDAGAGFVERYSQSSTHVHADWGPSRGDANSNYCIGRVP
jgi:hypothetical protein